MNNRMMARALCVMLLGASVQAPARAADASAICPDLQLSDQRNQVKVDTSFSLISKLLSKLGFDGSYESEVKARLPDKPEQFMALLNYVTICKIIVNDKNLNTDQKIERLNKWASSIFIYSHPNSSLFREWRWSAGVQLGFFNDERAKFSLRLVRDQASVTIDKETALSPPPSAPPRGAPILRVFLKKNVTLKSITQLRKLLPNYDIRIGKSEISPSNTADTIWVDRDKIDKATVMQVLRAFKEIGVDLKSVQQSHFGQREVQLGTIGDENREGQAFAKTPPLDLQKLGQLDGADFWKTAFNGQAWCKVKVGIVEKCSIDENGNSVKLR